MPAPHPEGFPVPAPRSSHPAGTATLTITPGAAPLTVPLTSDVLTLGRHPDCDIVLDDFTVSRAHAELHRTGDGFAITDLGSLNGTYVNREPVDQTLLTDGDTIRIGKYHLHFHSGTHRPSPTPTLAGTR